MTGELNQQQMNNILSSQVIGRIACCDGKYPYIVPMTYVFDGKNIYVQSLEGRKLELLRKNPNVCFEIDISSDMYSWQSVLAFGKFEELEGDESAVARERLYSSVMTLSTGATVHQHEHLEPGDPILEESERVKPIMCRINIQEMTGRFERR